MGKPDTSIKTTQQARDRLRVLAEEGGTTIADLVEELALSRLTASEREERAREAAADLGLAYTPELKARGQAAWDLVARHAEQQGKNSGTDAA
ncbi:hypothetical protein OG453_44730 [Streptomyces sp. NBC_01381]|uniref:hypothetical protein n=1 Tax=Streptomyces sp. NBC_01381 TaxID=2903845 RepID=UPI0022532918|nr:hypothetical protein [Streptomyces sp. NBC_01381]MCX4673665.1 hypothetical protein [Streptomyces sp. NBC_01381]